MRARDVGGVFASGRQANFDEGPPQLEFDDHRTAPSDPRARFGSARVWQQWVMGWTPPDGIYVPK
jgi:hypothetical protein